MLGGLYALSCACVRRPFLWSSILFTGFVVMEWLPGHPGPCPWLPVDAGADHVGRPLMVIVSRLTQQKGLPLMLHGIKVRRH